MEAKQNLQKQVILSSQTVLATGTAVLSSTLNASTSSTGIEQVGSTAVLGFANSDQNGQVEVYQGISESDILAAIAGTVPDAVIQDIFPLTGGSLTGVRFTVALRAPVCIVRFLNNSGVLQTRFRAFAYAVT